MKYFQPFAFAIALSLFGIYVLLPKRTQIFDPSNPMPRHHAKFINQPVEHTASSLRLSKLYKKQDAEQARSVIRLNDSDTFTSLNNDALPTKSAFGTDFSDPQWTQKLCKESDSENCAAKFKLLETRFRYTEKYNMSGCIIQKNMSTMLQAIMCYLYDEDKFIEKGRSVGKETHHGKFCVRKNEIDGSGNSTKPLNKMYDFMKDWLLIAIVREPVDRFLSGFVDKCVRQPYYPKDVYCNGCASNMTCFIESEYEKIMNNSKEEFPAHNFEDRHFFPQSWRCNFQTELKRYNLVQYWSNPEYSNKFLSTLLELFQKQGVPDAKLTYIREQLTGGRTVHSTVESEARIFFENRLLHSPYLLEYVFRMFYWDFELFNFQLQKYQL